MMLQAEHATMEWRHPRQRSHIWRTNRLWASSHFVPEEAMRCNDAIQEVNTQCVEESTVRIKDDFAFIIRDHTERAAMARPSDAAPWGLLKIFGSCIGHVMHHVISCNKSSNYMNSSIDYTTYYIMNYMLLHISLHKLHVKSNRYYMTYYLRYYTNNYM